MLGPEIIHETSTVITAVYKRHTIFSIHKSVTPPLPPPHHPHRGKKDKKDNLQKYFEEKGMIV